ncbi:hypothetical protein PYCCODRAFT_1465942 [Trametes coccinea BRFM310]|uniref:Uncharacterized protein n=1 Tax=Trametes coccinea (strain BRFM310) TaxID=1353009 RepID=A0A1Y2ITN0_TRAC3|nr:hypothetical protein PYCCODRAFT_1465942 [Trametes coccinea BRFM310]
MGQQIVNIDDNDTNDIDYQNPSLWQHELSQQNVQAGTYTQGFTNAVAKVTFNGTEVMVFGVANPPPSKNGTLPPSVTFSIDGGSNNLVSSPTVKTPQYSYEFYDSGKLSPGEHTLQILVNSGDKDWPFVLDYIQYVPLSSSSSSLPSSSSSSTLTSPSTSPTSATPNSQKSNHVGAIVGGVIGALVGLALLALGLWYYLSRTKREGTFATEEIGKVDLLDYVEPKPSVPSIMPSTTAVDSSYISPEIPFHRPSFAPDSMYAPSETGRPFSPEYGSRPSSPKLRRPATPPAVLPRPGTPPAITQRPATPPAVFYPPAFYPPGTNPPVVPSPLGKQADADHASVRSAAGPATVFHADSGIRFGPPPAPTTEEEELGTADAHSDIAISEVPPEYTES